MVKKLKNSIKKPIVSKSVILEVFKDQRTQMTRALNEEAVQQLIINMIKEIETDKSIIKIKQLYEKWGINPNEFVRLREKIEDVEMAYQFCMMMLGNRREVAGLSGDLNPGMIERSMPHYDDDWKKLVEWRAGLQSKTNDGYQNITVQMSPIPNSDLVPIKKSESIDVEEE
jgi:hypothetical protein